jgi:hypothetical protein
MGHLDRIGLDGLIARQEAAVAGIDAAGITFTVYSDGLGIDRAWPFDIMPRVIARTEWGGCPPASCSGSADQRSSPTCTTTSGSSRPTACSRPS